MAVTQIVFGDALDLSKGVGGLGILIFNDKVTSQTLTPSGSNQVSSVAAPALGNNPVCVVVTDTAVYVAIGHSPDPDATTTARRVMVQPGYFAFSCAPGDKAAIVTA